MANKIYTKTGDDGSTGLFGGKRVSKADLRVQVYGTIDELNSYIGLITTKNPPKELDEPLNNLNNILFVAGSDVATPLEPKPKFEIQRISKDNVLMLEQLIDEYTAKLPVLKNFILPGGTEVSALLQVARTVCRRAERHAVELTETEDLGPHLIKYLNRLSDYLFTAARYANFLAGVEETKWSGK
jgi:cob(I)alamin adenosyltransferase